MDDTPKDQLILEAWKQTIAVQQHFNDIELRIRNYAITLLGALFGVAAYAFKEHASWIIVEALLGASLILCYAFYFMDRHWYHRLLIGAVRHGVSIEDNAPPQLALTKAIGAASPVTLWWWKNELHSDTKITLFYSFIAGAIILMGLLICIFSTLNSTAAVANNKGVEPRPHETVLDTNTELAAPKTQKPSPTISATSNTTPTNQK